MSESPRPQRRTLLALLALFFLPLAAAFILYYGVGWRPAAGSNHGELLDPIRQLPAGFEALQGKWALVYVGSGSCDADCRATLVTGRQTRLVLNQEMTRVNRALFATDSCCDRAYLDQEHEGLQVFDLEALQLRDAVLAALPPGEHNHHLFIVDPLGNVVLRFDARENPRGLLSDLKKLLKLSHIG